MKSATRLCIFATLCLFPAAAVLGVTYAYVQHYLITEADGLHGLSDGLAEYFSQGYRVTWGWLTALLAHVAFFAFLVKREVLAHVILLFLLGNELFATVFPLLIGEPMVEFMAFFFALLHFAALVFMRSWGRDALNQTQMTS